MIQRHPFFFNLLAAVSMWLVLPTVLSSADEVQDREHLIKAGLLLKFTEFIQWPEQYGSTHSYEEPLNICIQGKDDFQKLLSLANDADIIRRNILVRNQVPLDLLKTCHIVFVSSSHNGQLDETLTTLKQHPVLVISESEGNGQKGVGINFIKINNKIRFEINHAAMKKLGLKVSSELINLAVLVFGEHPK